MQVSTADQAAWGKYGLQDLMNVEQDMRNMSELKREELRQLVGEKYRLLIESVDEIESMNSLVLKMMNNTHDITKQLDVLFTRDKIIYESVVPIKEIKEETLHITDGYEQVWNYLNINQYMKAVQVYKHAVMSQKSSINILLSDSECNQSELLRERQELEAIIPLKYEIVIESENRLKKCGLSLADYADALCAWKLVQDDNDNDESKTITSHKNNNIIEYFLNIRKETLEKYLMSGVKVSKRYNGQQQNNNEMKDICILICENIVNIIQSTIFYIYVLFTDSPKCTCPIDITALKDNNKTTTTTTEEEEEDKVDNIKKMIKIWYTDIEKCVGKHLLIILNNIQTGEDLAFVRDDIIKTIRLIHSIDPDQKLFPATSSTDNNNKDFSLSRRREIFSDACVLLFDNRIYIWSDMFHGSFELSCINMIDRFFVVKPLVELVFNEFKDTFGYDLTNNNDDDDDDVVIEKKLLFHVESKNDNKNDNNNTSYINLVDCCSDDENDNQHNDNNQNNNNQNNQQNDNIINMLFTDIWKDKVDIITIEIEEKFKETLSCVTHLLNLTSITLSDEIETLTSLVSSVLRPYVQKLCTNAVSLLISQLSSALNRIQDHMLDVDPTRYSLQDDKIIRYIHPAIFISYICLNLSNKSNALNDILLLETTVVMNSNQNTSPIKSKPIHANNKNNSHIQKSFLDTAKHGIRIWTQFLNEKLTDQVAKELRLHCAQDRLIHGCQRAELHDWNNAIPSQASSYIHNFLFKLTSNFYDVCGYELNKYVIEWLLTDTIDHIMNIYNDIIIEYKDILSMKCGLQILFDIMFLCMTLRISRRHKINNTTTLENSIKLLENNFDKVHYPLCRENLHKKITMLSSKYSFLYGPLLKANPLPLTEFQHDNVNNNNMNNNNNVSIMETSECSVRLKSLPVSLYPLRVKNNQILVKHSNMDTEISKKQQPIGTNITSKSIYSGFIEKFIG